MADQRKIGIEGEDLAADYLANKGYILMERNWHYKHKEVDIIARNNKYLVFVEIKSRKADYIVSPLDSVTMKKQRFIIEAANAYIEKYNIDIEVRFDIITIIYSPKITIEHIENAFYPKVR